MAIAPKAILTKLEGESFSDDVVQGYALLNTSGHERGGLEAEGLFRSDNAWLRSLDPQKFNAILFQYRGMAKVKGKQKKIEVVVYAVLEGHDGYRLIAAVEPTILDQF